MGGEPVRHDRHGWDFHHDAELELRATDLLAGAFAMFTQRFDLARMGDHWEQDPQRTVLRSAVQRPQLGI